MTIILKVPRWKKIVHSQKEQTGKEDKMTMDTKSLLDVNQKRSLMIALEKVVAETGKHVLTQRGTEISDTHHFKGHESSTIDAYAREMMQAAIDHHIPEFEGVVYFELRPYNRSIVGEKDHRNWALIIDEIEGTTNAKRCLAGPLPHRPSSLVSAALSMSDSLRDLIAGAVFTLDTEEVFSAFCVAGNQWMAFHNQKMLLPETFANAKGDSQKRVLVIGYSNSHRLKKGELEQALYDRGLRVYEGCRSSGMDIIYLLRNGIDAYIDLRHFWSTKNKEGKEKEAMLQVYDIAGVIPIAEGCGLKVTDASGNSWQGYNLEHTIPLVVSRPDIYEMIIEIVRPFAEKWKPVKMQ